MKRHRTLYAIVTVLMVLVLSVALMPVQAQEDDWPEGCELPDLDEAEIAWKSDDITGFVTAMSIINLDVDSILRACLETVAEMGNDLQDVYLGFADLNNANLQSINLQGASLYGSYLQQVDLSGANLSA